MPFISDRKKSINTISNKESVLQYLIKNTIVIIWLIMKYTAHRKCKILYIFSFIFFIVIYSFE